MGCFDSGGSESQSTSQAKTGSQTKAVDEAIALYKQELGRNENVFQGDRVTDFTGLQRDVLSGAENFLDTFTTPQVARNPLIGQATTATSSFLAGEPGARQISDDQFTDFFSQTFREPATRRFNQETLPGIAEDFAGPGFFGSSRSQAQTTARTDLADTLNSEEAAGRFANTLRNQDIDEAKAGRAQTAINQSLQVGRAPAVEIADNLRNAASQIQGMSALFGFGQAEQTQEQMELQADIQRFAEENQITDPQNLAILMALMDLNFSTSSSSGSTSGPGLGYVGASAALSSFGSTFGEGLATPKTTG